MPGMAVSIPARSRRSTAAARRTADAQDRQGDPRRAGAIGPGESRYDPQRRPLPCPAGALRHRAQAARRPGHLDPLRQRRRRERLGRLGLYPVGSRLGQGIGAARGPREQGRHHLGRKPRLDVSRHLLDPDRSDPARDDEQLGQFRQAAWPRGAAADAAKGQFPPHGIACGVEGARYAVDPVRDGLYLEPERRRVHRFGCRPSTHRGKRAACGGHSFRAAPGIERPDGDPRRFTRAASRNPAGNRRETC